MLKKIFSLIMLTGFALNITAFAHKATIENSGENKYKKIRLTPEIYNNANFDLSDLLILDEYGGKVPYFLNRGSSNTSMEEENFQMLLLNSYTKDDAFYFDYRIKTFPNRDTQATSIEFVTKSINFAKNIEVLGSYDNINWEKVQNDNIYNVEGNKKLEIIFNKPQKFTHYRFKLANNLEKIAFDNVRLKYSVINFEKSYFEENINPKFTTEEKDKNTYIKLEGIRNLRIGSITIKTNSKFKRMANTSLGGEKNIYNLSFNDISYTDTTLQIDGKKTSEESLLITIINNDDKPIDVSGITLKYYADEMIFESQNRSDYTLNFGKDENVKSPIYDIASYKEEILKNPIDRLIIKNIQFDEQKQEKKQYDYKMIFNIVIIIISVLLAVLILLKLRKKSV